MQMREVLDESLQYTNHVDQNIKVVKRFKDINKVVYLSKIKFNIENQLNRKQRMISRNQEKQEYLLKKSTKWDDFR